MEAPAEMESSFTGATVHQAGLVTIAIHACEIDYRIFIININDCVVWSQTVE